jgi:hypothetical protein
MSECTEDRFLKDAANHSMEVIKDDGVHRHLSFTNGGSSCYRFDLITWPGNLCIAGDCGTYVFSRIEDMFDFFRMKKNDFNHSKDRKLNINTGYWGEKLQAIGTNAGYEEYSEDLLKSEILRNVTDYWEFESTEIKDEVLQELEDDVFSQFGDDEYHDYHIADSFKSTHGHELTDLWECSFKQYTFHYLWCLYAIVYGIGVYDQSKKSKAA